MNPEDNRLSFSVASRLLTVMGTSLYPTPLDQARQASYRKASVYI